MADVITRFAPSPTGPLHLGHAFAAITAHDIALGAGGRFLVRIEDIDTARCTPYHEAQIFDDLSWLGLTWAAPPVRQSERRALYRGALEKLYALGVTYRCRCRRTDIRASLSAPQEGAVLGPDGPVYPGTCRHAGLDDPDATVRLNLSAALESLEAVEFVDTGPMHPGQHCFGKDVLLHTIGDIVLARRDIGLSYHLAVTVDDSDQGITLVTRGADLFAATPIHVILQRLLGLPTPKYHHHRLIRDQTGRRLAKRDDARALSVERAAGVTPADIRTRLGL